ncbi:MAG: 16S rRNA (cytidine(1402)-2'-O)-methyltransferase [Candidatus Kerfeldbacteria bacterium]|nr:16S rRNA (cytidine(1402)-2'-O)-methyltransferase [Candidatus Kerfeldbacteria bacterium]
MKTTGTLFVVGTPIGNLDDISRRALSTLESVNLVACEDTRVTKKLLDRYGLKPKLMSVHQHSGSAKIDEVIAGLKHGQHVAVVTDAGTPGVSDPGGLLVAAAYDAGIKVVAVPGPSAVTAALSVSGLPTNRFTFLGWLPHKKGRETMLQAIVASKYTVAFFESPHRIMRTLEKLKELLAADRTVVVARELTKVFEEVVRGSAGYVYDVFRDNPDRVRGEFVVVVGPQL